MAKDRSEPDLDRELADLARAGDVGERLAWLEHQVQELGAESLDPAALDELQVRKVHDHPEVGERLGEVPEERAALGVDLLGEEPDVVRLPEQRLDARARGVDVSERELGIGVKGGAQ